MAQRIDPIDDADPLRSDHQLITGPESSTRSGFYLSLLRMDEPTKSSGDYGSGKRGPGRKGGARPAASGRCRTSDTNSPAARWLTCGPSSNCRPEGGGQRNLG